MLLNEVVVVVEEEVVLPKMIQLVAEAKVQTVLVPKEQAQPRVDLFEAVGVSVAVVDVEWPCEKFGATPEPRIVGQGEAAIVAFRIVPAMDRKPWIVKPAPLEVEWQVGSDGCFFDRFESSGKCGTEGYSSGEDK